MLFSYHTLKVLPVSFAVWLEQKVILTDKSPFFVFILHRDDGSDCVGIEWLECAHRSGGRVSLDAMAARGLSS